MEHSVRLRAVDEPLICTGRALRIPSMRHSLAATGPLARQTSHERVGRFAPLIASPGPLVSILCWAGAALLIVSALIHLHLWSTGYKHIHIIGPLFLVQVVAGIVVALTVAISRHVLVALAGALFALGTLAGFIISVEVGLFGFQDTFSAPYATTSLIVESAAFAVLVVAALIGLQHGRGRAHR